MNTFFANEFFGSAGRAAIGGERPPGAEHTRARPGRGARPQDPAHERSEGGGPRTGGAPEAGRRPGRPGHGRAFATRPYRRHRNASVGRHQLTRDRGYIL